MVRPLSAIDQTLGYMLTTEFQAHREGEETEDTSPGRPNFKGPREAF